MFNQDYSRPATFAESIARENPVYRESEPIHWWKVTGIPEYQPRIDPNAHSMVYEGHGQFKENKENKDVFGMMADSQNLSRGGSSDQMKAWKASQQKPSSTPPKSLSKNMNDALAMGSKKFSDVKDAVKGAAGSAVNFGKDVFTGMSMHGVPVGELGIKPTTAQGLGIAIKGSEEFAKKNAVNIAKIIATVGLVGGSAMALKSWHERNLNADEDAVMAQAKEFKKMKRESPHHDLWGRGTSLRDHIEHEFYPQPNVRI